MRLSFDVSKVKKSSFFFKSNLTDSAQIFDAHLLENTNFSPSKLKTLKKFRFDKESFYQANDERTQLHIFLRNGRVRG